VKQTERPVFGRLAMLQFHEVLLDLLVQRQILIAVALNQVGK
jgi:hypothetical protein